MGIRGKSSDDVKMRDEHYFKWEGEILNIDRQIEELNKLSSIKGISYALDIQKKQKEKTKILKKIYNKLGGWENVQVARHPLRPVMKDYLEGMVNDFGEMHGDWYYGDDRAIICGLGKIVKYKVMVIGHNKRGVRLRNDLTDGESSLENIRCYSGCPNPEGFRKALTKMKFAEKFGIPIVTLIDTPGAYPGVGAEERGQGQAIACNLRGMSRLKVPIISVLVGEGGSGGALGLCGGANRFGALEFSYYSVISPEGCAAILLRDGNKKEVAAEVLKLSAKEGYKLGAIDDIINEPLGGAHRNPHGAIDEVKKYIVEAIRDFDGMSGDELVAQRVEMIGKRGGKDWRRKRISCLGCGD